MTLQFDDLGFAVNDEDALLALATKATGAGRQMPSPRGTYICWSPGVGVELWVLVGPQREILACHPHFAGRRGIPLQIAGLADGDPADAGLCAWTDLESAPLVLTIPDLDLVRDRLLPPQRVMVQITAFAHAAECFRTEPAYWAAQANKPFRMAPGFFIPSGAFAQPA
ncbi:MAG TPA: hypothetical protein VD902_05375, partial [Symbiobacteriaceae bacterium]|nr:hypothetical protein [Symbiobacteriaceae bacterium]